MIWKKPLVFTHFYNDLLLLLKTPSYSIMTMLIPLLFFLFFGVFATNSHENLHFLAASFSVFAAFGIVFFQFGTSVASDRDFPWYKFVRTLPVQPQIILIARTLSALTLSIIAVSMIVGTSILIEGSVPTHLLKFYVGVLLGAVPTALMGLALGYWLVPRNVLPAANLLYLLLSFLGGLWTPPQQFPDALMNITYYLPTYNWGLLVWSAVEGQPWVMSAIFILAVYTVLFGAIAILGYKRDEGTRFS
ncbi:MAG: ABC transporter permease [Trueperaceae bacterium]